MDGPGEPGIDTLMAGLTGDINYFRGLFRESEPHTGAHGPERSRNATAATPTAPGESRN